MASIGVFTPERAREIDQAVSRMGKRFESSIDVSRVPLQPQPVYRVKITGAADGSGVYPGKIMAFDATTLTWSVLGDCYAYKVDTI